MFIATHYNVCIVEPPNKGQCVSNNIVPCGEVVPNLEVKSDIHREVIPIYRLDAEHGELRVLESRGGASCSVQSTARGTHTHTHIHTHTHTLIPLSPTDWSPSNSCSSLKNTGNKVYTLLKTYFACHIDIFTILSSVEMQ